MTSAVVKKRPLEWVCLIVLSFLISSVTGKAADWVPLGAAPQRTATIPGTPPAITTVPTTAGYTISINISGFWDMPVSVDSDQYNAINLPNWSSMQQVGQPDVPRKLIMLPLPFDITPSVEILQADTVRLDSYQVIPAQPLPPDVYPEPDPPPFQKDAATYTSDTPYPESMLLDSRVVSMRDQRILVIELAPFQVFPESQAMEAAYHVELNVSLAPTPTTTHAPLPPTDASEAPGKYMVLMDDQFENNTVLDEFVDWKRRKGYEVDIVKTSDINPSGAPTNGEIVAYMRGLASSNYPDFLLILGDHTATNGVQGYYFLTYGGGYTDLDIACRDDSDWIPDLYYGRMPATNGYSASNMLSKALAMDRTPPTNDVFEKVCVAGQIQDNDPGNGIADRLFCETADAIACHFEQDAGGIDYDCVRALVNPDGMTATGYWNDYSLLWDSTNRIGSRIYDHFMSATDARNRIIEQVNAGIAVLQHRDHGYANGVGWADPQFVYYHINNNLTNGVKRPLVFSINCASGAYHMPNNFTRAWLEHVNGGAYAVFAPVDVSYSWRNDWLTHGFYAAFLTNYVSWQNASTNPTWDKHLPDPGGTYGDAGESLRLGEILNFGKMYMYEHYYADLTTFRLFHVFGDPESWLRLRTPEDLSVTHPDILTFGVQTVTVATGEADCQVCLYSEGLGVHEVQVTTNTSAIFTLNAESAGTLNVTVTRNDRRPYEGEISVVSGTNAFWFSAFAQTNSVTLRWPDPRNSGMGSKTVHIRSETGSYPSNTTQGTQVYQGDAIVYEHGGLTPGQPYYYTIWLSHDGANFTNPPNP